MSQWHPNCLQNNSYNKAKLVLVPNQGTDKEATTVCVWRALSMACWILKETVFIYQKVNYSLQTMVHSVRPKLTIMTGKDTIMQSERVTGLRVRGYSAIHIDLPPVYTKDCIPVIRTHIPTCEKARRWKHYWAWSSIMDEISSQLECEVGLLICYKDTGTTAGNSRRRQQALRNLHGSRVEYCRLFFTSPWLVKHHQCVP